MKGLQHPDELESFADPLSEDTNLSLSKSPWHTLRNDETLRQEIQQDVDRCMPDNLYFRQPATQNMLVDILFVWSKLNQDISYRQGMHELLAPIIWVVERDAVVLSPGPRTGPVSVVFDSMHIEHDSFTLFNVIMQSVKSAYDNSPAGTGSGHAMNTTVQEPPMVSRARKIVDVYLERVDPPLATHLREIDMLPQIFLMRWIRLLFGREFSFDDTLTVWDALFAHDPTLKCLDLVCVSMLLRVRWQLMDADYSAALTLLLKYPPFSADQHPSSLVNDAIYLQKHLDFDGGYHVIGKQTKRPPPLINRPAKSPMHERTWSELSSGQDNPFAVAGSPGGFETLVQDAARSMFARGQKLGLHKAVRDAIGEVKKNVQNFQPPMTRQTISDVRVTDNDLEDIFQRVAELEQRNKTLAKMLEGAIGDLWKQHKDVVENRPADDERVKSFTMAIAKVQLASVYLEDFSLPLPQEELDAVSSTRTSGGAPATSTTITSADVPREPVAPRGASSLGSKQASTSPAAHDPKSLSSTRPTLEQSSFSWMLGQGTSDNTSARSAFMSASPFTLRDSSEARDKGSLFGDEAPSQPLRGGSTLSATEKRSQREGPKSRELEPEDETLKLGPLSRQVGGDGEATTVRKTRQAP
ncbi:hypothetical protein FH972_024292 [Carpinus fangiana]|uniref:Rab-GAP TBC domain-containing protein n=1 Tax=Carpinus fangiana TaxID=176857 RepID=A0A5N6KY55_9ROSI|nr:hypothetical protein FH972_024292 [Carpinus fangiana]